MFIVNLNFSLDWPFVCFQGTEEMVQTDTSNKKAAPSTVTSITLDASTLEQLQKLMSNNGPGALLVLTPGGVCMVQTTDKVDTIESSQ